MIDPILLDTFFAALFTGVGYCLWGLILLVLFVVILRILVEGTDDDDDDGGGGTLQPVYQGTDR